MGGFSVMDQEALFVSALAMNIPKCVLVSFSEVMLWTITKCVCVNTLCQLCSVFANTNVFLHLIDQN